VHFAEDKSFEENLEVFLAVADNLDAEMAEILRRHVQVLKSCRDDASRRASRDAFNSAVLEDLKSLAVERQRAKQCGTT
jgi:hypothetical protein